MKRSFLALAVLLVVTFVLAGCSGTAVTTTTTVAPSTTASSQTSVPVQTTKPAAATTTAAASVKPTLTPKSGGILTMMISSDPNFLYPPVMTGQTDGQWAGMALESLFLIDRQFNLKPLLATDWKADGSFKTITITLRKGIKFSDGSDFNSTVCKWNLDQYRAGTRPELSKVSSIDLIDDYTLRLNLSTFDNTIIFNLANDADAGRMVSKQSFDANGGAAWAAQHPVGTGPFIFVSAVKDVGLTWKRNDNYWGGKPYLDGIQMKRYADTTVALMDFKAGNLDILGTTAPRDALALQKETTKYKVVIPPYGQVPALAGYASDPASIFSKLEVRQAISYSVDVKTWTDSFGLGFWIPQQSWAVPGTYFDNPNIKGYPYNPAKAKALLASATGSSTPVKTLLNFNNTGQSIVDENVGLQGYLNSAGFDCTLNPLLRPAFSDMSANQKGWSGIGREQGYSSPDPLIKYAGIVLGPEFKGIYMPKELVDAYNLAIAATDTATKKTLTDAFLALAVDKYCIATYLCVQATPQSKSVQVHDDLFGEEPYGYISPMTWLSR